jgi:hypothetical protein
MELRSHGWGVIIKVCGRIAYLFRDETTLMMVCLGEEEIGEGFTMREVLVCGYLP